MFSGNSERAVKIGEQIRCGMTNINDFGVNYLVQVRGGGEGAGGVLCFFYALLIGWLNGWLVDSMDLRGHRMKCGRVVDFIGV